MPPILYRRQRQTLDFINQYIQKFGYSPTLTEIKEALGLSSLSTVCEHLEVLEKKGYIRRYKGAVRGIEIIDEKKLPALDKGIELPVLGYIAAGKPIEPYTDPDATVFVPRKMVSGKKRSFVLQVKGDSMIEEGILDGDYIVVEEQKEANNGDIVVAILPNGFATLKKFYREKNRIRLEPANAKMKPIYVKNVSIQGKAVGVIRNFR
ncbi:transcriptional repressor LexA [bacterium]|nr:transcriptional repressor LexA [bacterium]